MPDTAAVGAALLTVVDTQSGYPAPVPLAVRDPHATLERHRRRLRRADRAEPGTTATRQTTR